jgi:hypothetical protein
MSRSRTMHASALTAWLVVFAATPVIAQTPDPTRGWTVLFDGTGRCFYSVPPDWKVDDVSEMITPFTSSPDGAVTATMRWSAHAPWESATADLRAMRQWKRVHDDSERRYWLEFNEPRARVLHVAVIPSASAGACTIQLEIGDDAREELRRLVPTIIGTFGSGR